jgi:hypothetical protein
MPGRARLLARRGRWNRAARSVTHMVPFWKAARAAHDSTNTFNRREAFPRVIQQRRGNGP